MATKIFIFNRCSLIIPGNLPFHDPYNLIYYLLPELPDSEMQILQQQKVQTCFGVVQIAIIGSSHFLFLNNIFCELLTCQSLNDKTNCFIQKAVDKKSFQYTIDFKYFKYLFEIESTILSFQEFNNFENSMLLKSNTLIQAFNNKSALTAINIEQNTQDNFRVETWHTYPESLTIIKTQTQLTIL